MKHFILFISVLFTCGVMAQDIASLRGAHSIDSLSKAATPKKWYKNKDGELIKRSFEEQPPLIPHKSNNPTINLSENRCLKCHSNANYKEEEAPKMGDSHFVNRAGDVLNVVSSGRYFCTQCHVTQVTATPLVEISY